MQPGAKKLITARRLLSTESIVSKVRRYTQYDFIRNCINSKFVGFFGEDTVR